MARAIRHPIMGRIPRLGRPSTAETERNHLQKKIREIHGEEAVNKAIEQLCQSCKRWVDVGKIKKCQHELIPVTLNGGICAYWEGGVNEEPWKKERKKRKAHVLGKKNNTEKES